MRRRIIIGGMVVMGVGYSAYKMSSKEVEQVEQHTGKKAEDLTEDEMNQAMDDLGIEGQEVSDAEMAQLEAADDAANAAAGAPQDPATEAPAAPAEAEEAPASPAAPAPEASTQPGYVGELEQLAKLHEQGILTDEEFSAKKAQLLGI